MGNPGPACASAIRLKPMCVMTPIVTAQMTPSTAGTNVFASPEPIQSSSNRCDPRDRPEAQATVMRPNRITHANSNITMIDVASSAVRSGYNNRTDERIACIAATATNRLPNVRSSAAIGPSTSTAPFMRTRRHVCSVPPCLCGSNSHAQTFSFSMRLIASSTFSRELNALMRK